ncbi:hypothetical protein ACHAWF_011870, partial [Thalassiosira exigua]
ADPTLPARSSHCSRRRRRRRCASHSASTGTSQAQCTVHVPPLLRTMEEAEPPAPDASPGADPPSPGPGGGDGGAGASENGGDPDTDAGAAIERSSPPAQSKDDDEKPPTTTTSDGETPESPAGNAEDRAEDVPRDDVPRDRARVDAAAPSSSSSSSPAPAPPAAVGVSKNRTKGDLRASDAKRCSDFGEFGFYVGALDEAGERRGRGKMCYDSGNSFEGSFARGAVEGEGTYRWLDGDEQEGSWSKGLRHGTSAFRSAADGVVEYATYVEGEAKGAGLSWSADRNTAYETVDGWKRREVSPEEAARLAREKFGMPVPAPAEVVVPPPPSGPPKSSRGRIGLLGRIFSARKLGDDGTMFFKDHGEWGSYEGSVDEAGNRQGLGVMSYDSGNAYEGGFVDDKFHGEEGAYRWSDGDAYVGAWKDGERHGIGTFRSADGAVECSTYEGGSAVGEGVRWSPDRTRAHKLADGERTDEMSPSAAEKLAREKFDLPVPAPSDAVVPAPAAPTKSVGFLGRMFGTKKMGPDGKMMFYDNGEWGTYDGPLDSDRNREGTGKMSYESGNAYEGGFVGDRYHGARGVYRWSDGDEYDGPWEGGERHGKGTFRFADGRVDYSTYKRGSHVGVGVGWSPDRKTAYKLIAGEKENEISLAMAEKLAKDKFDLPVPEASPPAPTPSPAGPTPSEKGGLLVRLFAKKKVGPDGKMMFYDNGEWGTYDGTVDENQNRQGRGKMTYGQGSSYEGGFVDDKYHGDKGVYRWSDGDEYEGSWKDGERHGIGIFRSADGSVDYSRYETGSHVGEGVSWSPTRLKAHKMKDGNKTSQMLLAMAEKLAKDLFDLPVPEKFSPSSPSVPAPSKNDGFLGRLFAKKKVGPDGKMMFYDHGEWGTYDGDVDADQNRQGQGKMTYDRGNSYEGGFVDDKYHGDKGIYRWSDGDEYEGPWKDGERHGIGVFRSADGTVDYSRYENGSHVGEGVAWSPDRKEAHKTVDGDKKNEISLAMAKKLVKDEFDLPVPEKSSVSTAVSSAPALSKNNGFLGRLMAKKKVGPDGKMMFYDNGEWGTYDGALDENQNRQGQGKMTYSKGNWYEGGFVDDKYHGDKGVYRWANGDEYEGSWKDGERHGIYIFRSADGSVDYSRYENGSHVGEGVTWSPDRQKSHKVVAGDKANEISLTMAKKLAEDLFDLPVPEKSSASSASAPRPTPSSNVGFIGRLFAKKKMGPDGKMMFYDNGEWGSYVKGDIDNAENRQGQGKMSYASGNWYEGGFVDDKYHGDRGIYYWSDGDEYEGSWQDGERHGKGIFRSVDGSVEYSMYEKESSTGEGVWWSADRKSAYTMLNGVKQMELMIEEAESIAKEKFGLSIPEFRATKVSAVVEPSQRAPTSFIGRLIRSSDDGVIGSDGIMRFKDYGEWGNYDGEFDSTGKRRHGKGVMTYNGGTSYYKGNFVENEFHGDNGVYRWSDGDEYEGSWYEGERHGIGIFRMANGCVEYSIYDKGQCKGEGVVWSPDRKTANKLLDGDKKDAIALAFAKKFAKDKFDLPVPEPSAVPLQPLSPSLIGRILQPKENNDVPSVSNGQFEDYGDTGTYYGPVENELRQGEGKMVYDSGSSYEGDFSQGKFDGNRGLYKWADGTEYEGSWKRGAFDGIGVFRIPGVGVDYSMYSNGFATGVGVAWDADFTKAYFTLDGERTNEASLVEAEKLAIAKFKLPAPSSARQLGLASRLGGLFKGKKVGADGKLQFKDNGDWGSYEGCVDTDGNRQGPGKMTYGGSGNFYEGGFKDNKYHGTDGKYIWANGDEYQGQWEDGERHGIGIFRSADGSVEYSNYEKGAHAGEGVWWSADRKTASKVMNGEKTLDILVEEAEVFAKEKFGLEVPAPSEVSPKPLPAPNASKNIGIVGRIFSSRSVGSDGRTYFKDYGEWGYYEGEVDEKGRRQGKGKMTYDSGTWYEGSFVDDKFHGNYGVYHWFDGEEYRGQWKDGERHGKGQLINKDRSVEYSCYERGEAKGEGVKISADRKAAKIIVDGTTKSEMLLEEAESFLKEKLGISIASGRKNVT